MRGVENLYKLLVGGTYSPVISTENFLEETQKILLVITPQSLPGWSIIAASSHSRRKTLWWLIARCLFQEASDKEKAILRLLTVGDPEFVHEIVDFIISTKSGRTRIRAANLLVVLFPELTERFLVSFRPTVRLQKVWTEIRKLPPKRFVGMGYNDHGTLASTPSWKEQMLTGLESPDVIERVRFILRLSLDRFSPPSLVGLNSSDPGHQAEESQERTKRRMKG